MDFSRPRLRLGGGAGGTQVVKTYGRFKQRIVHREAKGAQEFARVTGASTALADILGQSSDSDFEEEPPSRVAHAAADGSARAKPAKENAQPTRSRRNTASDGAAPLGGDAQPKAPPHDHPAEAAAKTRPRPGRKESSATHKAPVAAAQDAAGEPPKRRSRAQSSSSDRAPGPKPQAICPDPKDAHTSAADGTATENGPAVGAAAPDAGCEQAVPPPVQPKAAPSPISGGNVTRRRTSRRSRSKHSRDPRSSSPVAAEPRVGENPAVVAAPPPRSDDILARRLSHVSVRDPGPGLDRALVQGAGTTEPAAASACDDDCYDRAPEPAAEERMQEDDACPGESDESARQHLAVRAMRFKAPHNARAQTFELDSDGDADGNGNDGQHAWSTPARGSRPGIHGPPLANGGGDPPATPLRPTQEYALPTPPRQRPDMTPQRLSQRLAEHLHDVPRSPARMTTPHRVVYSPTRPMTQMRPRIDPAETVEAAPEAVPEPTSQPARPGLEAAVCGPAPPAERLSLGRDPGTGNQAPGGGEGAPDAEIEETRVPFLPARRYVQKAHILAACGQTEPIDWAAGGLQACGVLLPSADPAQHSTAQLNEIESEAGLCKIGEATYSEVFSAQWRYVPRTRYDRFNSKKGAVKGERLMQVALKVIPFGNPGVKSGTGEPQTTLRDLYQEIGATLALSRLSERERAKLQEARLQVKMPLKPKERELGANFVKAFRVCICQGPLPPPLLRAWDRWKGEYPALCENVRPDYYPPAQLFAVFVLEMGGETLENADVATWKEARSIIRQLALSMALAERNNRFEHRDLHWGNIMVTRYPSNLTFLYQLPPSGTRVKSTLISIPSYRLRCTIIDYTLSRLHIDNDAQDAAGARPTGYDAANNVFYVALKDEALFRGEGDIQYDVYRQMRAAAADRWEGFHPHTNVLWLVYVLQKILTTKAPAIRDELVAFAESKLGAAFDAAPPELRRAACQELLRRWMREFEQCESSSHVLRCALLDLYKG